jgi:hypothetical protein
MSNLSSATFGSNLFLEKPVPRFYFDVREGNSLTRDEVGLEFDTIDAAEVAAAAAAAEIGRDRLPAGDAREVTVEVKDEGGFLLVTATVSLAVRRTARALV